MLLSLLGYPFALAARRPLGVLTSVGLGVALCMALDIAFAANGVDVLTSDELTFGSDSRLYDLLGGIVTTFVGGFVMALALIDLGERSGRNPDLGDGVALFAMNLLYGLIVAIPIGLAALLSVGAVMHVLPGPIGIALAVVLATAWLLVFVYVSARLAFAGPRSLAGGRIVFLKTWSETKGRVWPILGLNIAAALVIAVLFVVLASVVILFVEQLLPQRVDTVSAALAPAALSFSFTMQMLLTLAGAYFAAAQAYIFHRLKPVEAR